MPLLQDRAVGQGNSMLETTLENIAGNVAWHYSHLKGVGDAALYLVPQSSRPINCPAPIGPLGTVDNWQGFQGGFSGKGTIPRLRHPARQTTG